MDEQFYFKILKSVDSIGKSFIDGISKDPHCTYEWFKTMENIMKQNVYYVTVYCDQSLVAVAPCFIDLEDVYYGNAPKVIPLLKKILIAANLFNIFNRHMLLCYSPAGCFRSEILLDEKYAENQVLDKISEGIDYICKLERISISCFVCVSASEVNLINSLNHFGYRKFFWRNTYSVKIRWKTFDEYLMSLDYKIRKNVRRELKKSEQNGVKIEVLSEFGHLSSILPGLYSNLYFKYNHRRPFYYDVSFFDSLSRHAEDKVRLFVAKKNEKIVGFTLCMQQKGNLEGFKCGFDYSACSKNDYVYFNLTYYTPLKWAIENGIDEVYYGPGMGEIKSRRGCTSVETFSFVKCHDGILDSLARVSSVAPPRLKKKLDLGIEIQ
jgi:predicted N-acyltransferase